MRGMNTGGPGELLLGQVSCPPELSESIGAVFCHGRVLSGTLPDLSRAIPDFLRASSTPVVEALDDPRTLPVKLRSERERQNLTVQWIADRIGVSKQSVSAFENGQEPVGEEAIQKWVVALQLPGSWAEDWAFWRRAEKAVNALRPVRGRSKGPRVPSVIDLTPEQREEMQMVIFRQLRGRRP